MKIGVVIHTKLLNQIFTPEDLARLDTLGEVVWTDSPDPPYRASDCAFAGM